MTDTTETARQYAATSDDDITQIIQALRTYAKREWGLGSHVPHLMDESADALSRLRAEHAKLLGFVRDAVRYVAIGMDPNTLHEKACEHGIIIADSPDGPCSEQCACALRGFFPTTCFRLADFVMTP